MLPADQFSAADEEYLHHCLVFISGDGDDIPVFLIPAGDLLALRHLSDAVDEIPVNRCLLKLHILRQLFHFLLQIIQHFFRISVQKGNCLLEILPVFLPVHTALAGRRTLPHLMVQAGPLLPHIPR